MTTDHRSHYSLMRGQHRANAFGGELGVRQKLIRLSNLADQDFGTADNGGAVMFLARAIRSVRSWVADVAEFFGFHDAAQAWRSFAAQDQTRDLVVSTFARLREGAPPSMMTTNWHYSDPAFMVAWHGSPHDHDGFSVDRIGSGEGPQAYGWGLYFASKREVAEHYRPAGRYGDTFEYGKTIKDIRANLKERHGTGNFRVTRDGEIHARDDDGMCKFKGWVPPAGKLYKVELAPSEDEYLDWDKPLSEQSEFVQKSIRPLVKSFANDLGEKFSSIWNDYAGTFYQYLARSYTAKAAQW